MPSLIINISRQGLIYIPVLFLLNAIKDGASTDSGYGVEGRLHTYRSIRIYSKALSAEEINYNIEYDQMAFVRSKASTVSLQRYKSVRTRATIELFEESNNFSDVWFIFK